MGSPLSQAVHDRAELLFRSHPWRTVAEMIGTSTSQIHQMRARGWLAVGHTRPLRARPSDFAIQYRHMNHAELRAHYRASSAAVTRWTKELTR